MSTRPGNAQTQSGRWNELTPWNLYHSIQSTTQTGQASLQRRYKAQVVDADSPSYFHTVCDYLHLNPVRAKVLTADQALREYLWSSCPE